MIHSRAQLSSQTIDDVIIDLPEDSSVEPDKGCEWNDSCDKEPDQVNVEERVVFVQPQVRRLVVHQRHVDLVLQHDLVADLLLTKIEFAETLTKSSISWFLFGIKPSTYILFITKFI